MPNTKTSFRLLLLTAAIAALSACGGGDTEQKGANTATSANSAAADSEAATAAGSNAPIPTNIVSVDTDLRKKVIYLGDQGGFVAKALAATLPIGSDADYDILVIGDADKLGGTALTAAQQALASGKEVVFDGPSDNSDRSTHANILATLVGTRIDVAAVRVEKAVQGYDVTPIDAPAIAQVKIKTAAAKGAQLNGNTVSTVFGINTSSETSK